MIMIKLKHILFKKQYSSGGKPYLPNPKVQGSNPTHICYFLNIHVYPLKNQKYPPLCFGFEPRTQWTTSFPELWTANKNYITICVCNANLLKAYLEY